MNRTTTPLKHVATLAAGGTPRVDEPRNWTDDDTETFDPVVMQSGEWQQLINGGEVSAHTYAQLSQAGLLATPDDDASLLNEARLRLRAAIESTQVLYVIASDGCNMACSYCPIPVRANLDRLMPVEVFQHAVREMVQAGPAEQRFILLYGGEPLENLALLEHIVERFTELSCVDSAQLEILVCTNLTGLSDRVVDLLKRAPFKVVAGIDVPTGNARVMPDRSSTHLDTIEAAMRLIANGIGTFASTTLLPDNAAQVPAFLSRLKGYGFQGAGLNLLRGARGKQLLDHAGITIEQYAAVASECFRRIAADVGLRKFEYNTVSRYARLTSSVGFDLDCHAYGNQVVVYPDGTKGSCYLRGDKAYKPGIQGLARVPLFNPACDGCAARPICGGGCPWSAEELTGLPDGIDPIACQVTKAVNPTIVRGAVSP